MTKIYIPKITPIYIKQYTNTKLIWIYGLRKSIKTKIVTKNKIKKEDNYLVIKKTKINEIYKNYNIISKEEKKKEKAKKTWTERTFRKKIISLTNGYVKYLRVKGVGYRFELKKNNILSIEIGYSYKLEIKIPKKYSIKFSKKKSKWKIKATDLQELTSYIAKIRKLRLPDVYKGKGIRYIKDPIKIKIGKIKK